MEKILELLDYLLPNFAVQPITRQVQGVDETTIDLPAATGADYFFRLCIEPEMQIGAKLTAKDPDDNYFWYMPFESAAFGWSEESLEVAFCETVEKLLTHETRISQKNSWLNWHFKCEYKTANGWKRIYGHSALKLGGWKTPKIDGRVHVYHSSSLVHQA